MGSSEGIGDISGVRVGGIEVGGIDVSGDAVGDSILGACEVADELHPAKLNTTLIRMAMGFRYFFVNMVISKYETIVLFDDRIGSIHSYSL